MAKGDDIQDRLIEFAVKVMELCDELCRIISASRKTAEINARRL